MTEFKLYNVFGWYFHRGTMNAGDQLMTNVSEDISRKDLDIINLYTLGKVSISLEGSDKILHTREAGEYSCDRPNIIAGKYISTATEFVEFWCVSHEINKKRLPDLSVFRLKTGETCEVSIGSKLFICTGRLIVNTKSLIGPEAINFSKDATVKASSDCLGLFFNKEK